MKAHINQQAARPLALLYGLPESTETGRGVRAALEEQGFSSKEIAPEQLLQPVGALAGLGGKAAPLYSGEAPDTQLLLMSNFTSPQLNAVLDALREAGVHVPLKAVVTKHNKTWSVLALLEELQREREATRRLKTHPAGAATGRGNIVWIFAPIIADVKAAKCAGFRYQRAGHHATATASRYTGTAACCSSASVMAKQRAWCSSCGRRARTIPARLNGIFQMQCHQRPGRGAAPADGRGAGGLCLTAGPRAGSVWTS